MITFLLQVSGSMVLFYTLYIALLKRETFFQLNRFYLLKSAILSLCLPFLAMYFPTSENLAILPTQWLDTVTVGALPTQASWQLLTGKEWLVVGYFGGVIFMTFRLSQKLGRLLQLTKQLKGENATGYRLLFTEGTLPTFSFLHYVFWDNSLRLEKEESDKILKHELAHVRGKHSIDMLLMEVLKAIFWFNPVVYWYQSALSEQHEYAADAAVLKSCDKYTYGQLMIKNLFTQSHLTFTHSFNHSPIKKRILMMNRAKTPSFKKAKIFFAIPLAVLVTLFYSCENEQLIETPQAIEKKAGLGAETIATNQTANDPIFEVTEVPAKPIGGMEALYQYIAENITYPKQAQDIGVEGRVFVRFVVEKDGSISPENVEVVRGIGAGCDAEAVRVIKNMPVWKNAEQKGRAVRQRILLPIKFALK